MARAHSRRRGHRWRVRSPAHEAAVAGRRRHPSRRPRPRVRRGRGRRRAARRAVPRADRGEVARAAVAAGRRRRARATRSWLRPARPPARPRARPSPLVPQPPRWQEVRSFVPRSSRGRRCSGCPSPSSTWARWRSRWARPRKPRQDHQEPGQVGAKRGQGLAKASELAEDIGKTLS